MERVRQVTLAAAVVAALGGCAATDRLTANLHEAKRAVGMDPAGPPPTTLLVLMHRRLESLPAGPDRPDQQQLGLPGQLFLLGADGKPAAADGDLVVTVTDDTPRQPGQPPRTTEKWHFTPDVLPRLRTRDERFGECYVLFLPWPAEWKDVTRVTVRANYKPAVGVELFAKDTTVNLDLGDNRVHDQWEKLGAAKTSVPPPAVPAGQPIPITPASPAQPAFLPPPSQAPAVPQLQPVPPPAPPPVPGPPQTIVVPRG